MALAPVGSLRRSVQAEHNCAMDGPAGFGRPIRSRVAPKKRVFSHGASKFVSGLTVMFRLLRLETLQSIVVMRLLCLVCQPRVNSIHHDYPLSLHMLVRASRWAVSLRITHKLMNIRYVFRCIRGLSPADN
jgi:hypothetical protein